jgi:hypothetical protein
VQHHKATSHFYWLQIVIHQYCHYYGGTVQPSEGNIPFLLAADRHTSVLSLLWGDSATAEGNIPFLLAADRHTSVLSLLWGDSTTIIRQHPISIGCRSSDDASYFIDV